MLTIEQERIYEGLKMIGQSLANFYLDGIRMINPSCLLQSKANLIAHAVREIDGGLRDVFSPKKIKNEISKSISGVEEEAKGYFASILAAIGKDDPKDELANKWHSIAKKFHRIAHRKDIHDVNSVDPTEIITLWNEYEKVLFVVIGTFLGVTNRMDVLLKLDEPQYDSLPALKNILSNIKNAEYFFSRLNKTGWLLPLMENGYFDVQSVQIVPMERSPEQWYPLKYLLGISSLAQRNVKENLKKIIYRVMQAYCDDKIRLHTYTMIDITQIMINIDDYQFGELEHNFFEKYSKDEHQSSWNLVHSNLAEGFTAKLIASRDKKSLERLLEYFFGFTTYREKGINFLDTEVEPYIQKRPNVREHFIQDLMRLNGDAIVELLGPVAIEIAMQKLVDLVRIGSHSLTNGAPASIESTSQSVYANGWETTIVYFIRDFASKLDSVQLGNIIDKLMAAKTQILQRLGIHFIRLNFTVYGDRWWKFIQETGPNDDLYIHEPYILLKDTSASFTDEQFEKVIGWIEKINPTQEELDSLYGHDFAAYQIRRWLSALTPPNQTCKDLLEAKEKEYLHRNASKMIDHPEFSSWGESKVGYDFPIELKQFQEMDVADQVSFIKSFKPEHDFDTTELGLAQLLRVAVADNPLKYLFSMDEFIPLNTLHLSNMLEGFIVAIKNNKLEDSSLVIDFIEKKLADKSFSAETTKGYHYRKWFGTSSSNLISALAEKNDARALSKKQLERLIILVLSMINTPEFEDNNDEMPSGYIDHVLNSTIGRLYGVLIQLTQIWSEDFAPKEQDSKWPEIVKEHFTNLLDNTENNTKEFSITLGMEFPLLLFWDKKWIGENLSRIFNESNPRHFDYRFHTVFSRKYKHSQFFYEFLVKHALFKKALRYFVKDSQALDTVILYGLLEWKFWNGDPDNDSIIAEILFLRNPEHIKRLIHQASDQRIFSPEELIFLWERTITLFDTIPELKDHVSILLWLFESMPELTVRVYELSSSIISKTTDGKDIYSFLRHLYLIADSNLELAGKLVEQIYSQKLVTAAFYFELKEFVRKLYENGFKEIANKIAIEVTEQGNLILKELYNEFN